MPDKADGAGATEIVEVLTSQEIDTMMAEAKAVDALFERMSRARFGLATAVAAYFSPPALGASSIPAKTSGEHSSD
jgi:hypothetical protein